MKYTLHNTYRGLSSDNRAQPQLVRDQAPRP